MTTEVSRTPAHASDQPEHCWRCGTPLVWAGRLVCPKPCCPGASVPPESAWGEGGTAIMRSVRWADTAPSDFSPRVADGRVAGEPRPVGEW